MATWKKVIVSGSDAHLNIITGSGLEISGIVSGSTISGSFIGDGSELTGVSATSFNIDGLSNGSDIIAGDKIFYSDGGTEKKVTFSNLEDSIFDNISGDATVAAGGALTIEALAVETGMLAADAVTAAKLADDAVVTANIVDLNVTTGKIAAYAITGAKIADDAINSEHYTDGSIDTAHIADSQVTTAGTPLSTSARIVSSK